MNENNNILQQMRTTFEELEKRIKAMERSIGINAQVTALVSYMQEVKSYLEQFEEEYSLHLTEFSEHTTDYNTFKQSTQNSINANNTTDNNQSLLINNLSTSVTQLQTSILSLNQKVTSLEQSQGGEVENTDYEKLYLNLYTSKEKIYLPRISIFGDISHMVDVKISINLTRTSETNSTALTYSAYINGTKQGDYDISCEAGKTVTVEFAHKFTNNNLLNYFDFVINNSSNSNVNYVEVIAKGKNVKIYSIMAKKMSICCFSDKYYITNQEELGKLKFCEIEKSQLDNFQEYLTEIDKLSLNSYPTKVEIIPITKKNSQTGLLEKNTSFSSNGLAGFVNSSPNVSGFYMCDYNSNTFSKKIGYAYTVGMFDCAPYTDKLEGATVCIPLIDEKSCIIFEQKSTDTANQLKLNDTKVQNVISASLVKDNSLGYSSTTGGLKGIITIDNTAMVSYYPSRNSTYKVDIAKGKNATAYLQPNGNINVYISTNKVVKKYVLCLDPITNQYQLQGETNEFVGITSYEELYDNKALVYTYDNYEIIENQEF